MRLLFASIHSDLDPCGGALSMRELLELLAARGCGSLVPVFVLGPKRGTVTNYHLLLVYPSLEADRSDAMETQPFRILSLDGGGIMGAFAASALATFERATGRRIVDHFDLITGTSTGGIIAIGLAMGATAEEICRFYGEEGARIFPSRGGLGGWLGRPWNVFRPKYTSQTLRQTIAKVTGDRPLKEAMTRLVIPSYDVNTGKVYLFKTPHHENYTHHADVAAADVALATSAAPTYFPAHSIAGRGTFIDGGLWANCPVMVGVVEALDFLGQAPQNVRMLSVSTTSYPFRIEQARPATRAPGMGTETHRYVYVRPGTSGGERGLLPAQARRVSSR